MPENENTEVDEVEDDDIEEVEEQEDEEWTPPSKDEWHRVSNAAKARHSELKTLRRELGELKKNLKGGEDREGDDEVQRWRSTAARNSAASALASAGFQGTTKQARRLTRLLDLENAEPDSSGDFDFEDDIEALKEEFPSLFAEPGEQRRRAPKVTTSDRGRNAGGTVRDRTTEKLLKQAGFR